MNKLFFRKNLTSFLKGNHRISLFLYRNNVKGFFNLHKNIKKHFSTNDNNNPDEEIIVENLDKVETKITPFQEKPLEHKDQEDTTLKQEGMPFIQYSHPILPFTQIINKNFNRKELLFNLALKYGKITQIDEETTQIDDIVLYWDKEDIKKINKEEGHNYGILCQIKVKKNNYFVIEGLNKILQVKSTIGFGKYRFFKPNHATEITPIYTLSEEYYKNSFVLVKEISEKLEFIKNVLNHEEDNFGMLKLKFPSELNEIKLYLHDIENRISNAENELVKETLYQEFFLEIYKFISYFIMKLNFFKTSFFQTEFEFFKYFQNREILEKLVGINSELNNFSEFIDLKYEKYGFKFNYNLNFDNPFAKNTEEEVKRLQKYKLALEHKISN